MMTKKMWRAGTLVLLMGSSLALTACSTWQTKKLTQEEIYAKEYDYLFVNEDDLNPAWNLLENMRYSYKQNPTAEKYARFVYLYNRYAESINWRNFATQNYLNTTRLLHKTWDNIGRGGAAERQPGYIHVLGGEAVYNNVAVRYDTARKKLPASRQSSKKIIHKLNPEDLAWSRYCNYGRGMTEKDWEIVIAANMEVPAKYLKNCRYPKL